MRHLILVLLCVGGTAVSLAQDLSAKYRVGEGSKFQLSISGIPSEVLIYVSHAKIKEVGLETHFSAKGLGIPLELWQQMSLEHKGPGVTIRDMMIYSPELETPEKVPVDKLKGGFDLSGFLTLDAKSVDGTKIGEETLTTPAGKVKTIHYRKQIKGETYDFWMSDEAKPIGMVRLVSSGKQRFEMTLMSLLKNVRRKIDPTKAVPLTQKGRNLLGLAGNLPILP